MSRFSKSDMLMLFDKAPEYATVYVNDGVRDTFGNVSDWYTRDGCLELNVTRGKTKRVTAIPYSKITSVVISWEDGE